MTRKRIWLASRQAYYPRMWPLWVAVLPVAFAFNLTMTFIAAFPRGLIAAGLCALVALVRVQLWKRRHPVLSPDEVLRRKRDAAPYN